MSRLLDDLKYIESMPLAPVFGDVSPHDEAEYKPNAGGAEDLMKLLQTRFHIQGDALHSVRILCPGGGVVKADSRSDAEWLVAELNRLLDEVARLGAAVKVLDEVIKRQGPATHQLIMDEFEVMLEERESSVSRGSYEQILRVPVTGDGSQQSWES